MAKYKNFFETVEEANMRLKGTIVLYAGMPYHVWAITNHKADGIFRIYLSSLKTVGEGWSPQAVNHFPIGSPALGPELDKYVDGDLKDPNYPVLRKNMDSPKFDNYRPFPLGMLNQAGRAIYIERSPNRPKTEQGLTTGQLRQTVISIESKGAIPTPNGNYPSIYTEEFRDCILGQYPSPKECLDGLLSDKNVNTSVAFHRNFALVKGPINTIFLAYKGNVVGLLIRNNYSEIRLGGDFKHVKEAIAELNLFSVVS